MTTPLFDHRRPEPRRSSDSADHFLLDRATEDLADHLHSPPRRCAIVGRRGIDLERRMHDEGAELVVLDPAPLQAGDPAAILADPAWNAGVGGYDLVLAIGLLDRCNDPALAAAVLGGLLAPGGRLLGVLVGGDTLAALRGAMLDADRAIGRAAIRIHPMMDGSGLAGLLAGAGLVDPVVSVDRVEVRYRAAGRLVADLRAMGCTRRLSARSPALTRAQWTAIQRSLGTPFTERFDLLHFHALKGEGERG